MHNKKHNKMKFRYLSFALCALFALAAQAANVKRARQATPTYADSLQQVVQAYMDSLSASHERIVQTSPDEQSGLRVSDGRYYRLFAPFTFYHSPAHRYFSLAPSGQADDVEAGIDRALFDVYLERPDLVKETERQLSRVGGLRGDVGRRGEQRVRFTERVKPEPLETPMDAPLGVVIRKPNFWVMKGDYYLQLLQSYVSDNWYKGGENSYSMLGALNMDFNYDDKQKVKWENKVELKLGLQTTESDTLHKFRTSEDLIRLTSRVGLQAAKHWYYTLQMIAQTQFAKGLKSNDKFVYSDFLSPFNLNFAIGMDWSFATKDKRMSGSLNIAPLTLNYKYVDRLDLGGRNGLDEGKKSKVDYGSSFTCNAKWKVTNNIGYETRLWAYTTYKRTEIEWENTITFQLSRYISAKLFLYPRFDDSRVRDDDYGYFQFKQYATLGFNYNF